MNAAFVTFTCARDADLVPLWAHGVRRWCPEAPLVAVVDRGDELMPLPRGVARMVSDFDRRGNLNGVEAVAGILGALLQVARLTGLPVVKMDCDSVLMGARWLEVLQEVDYVGFEGGHALTATGICYAMTQQGLERIVQGCSPWPWQTAGKLPEDQTVYALSQLYARARLFPWAQGEWVLAFMPQHFGAPQVLRRAQVAVHCGQAAALGNYGKAVLRAHVVARMMRCVLRMLWKGYGWSPREVARAAM